MATFEEKWAQFKAELETHVPEWQTKFLDWANQRGYHFHGSGFFNEFPHTHAYETDLSWLISRMKWVLFRQDSVEERMALVEKMLIEFVETLDIDQLIKSALQELIDGGAIEEILNALFEPARKAMSVEVWCSNTPTNAQAATINSMICTYQNGIFYFMYKFDLPAGTAGGSTTISNLDMISELPEFSSETLKEFVTRKCAEYDTFYGNGVITAIPATMRNDLQPQGSYMLDAQGATAYYGETNNGTLTIQLIKSGNNGPSGVYRTTGSVVTNKRGVSIVPITSRIG